MNARMLRGRWVWAAVALVAVAVLAAGGSQAKPGDKDSGYLGVYMQKLTRDVRDGLDLKVKNGVLISGIEDDSPAAEAGLEDGDVVVEFNGKDVTSPDDLRDMVRDTKPGETAKLVVIRDGDRKTIEVTVGERPEGFAFGWVDNDDNDMQWFHGDGSGHFAGFLGGPRLGVTAAELNDDLAGYFDTKPGSGVLVLDVSDDSVAEKAGVKAGDVIQKVGDESIASVDGLRASMRDFDEGDEFDVTVLRKGKKQTLKATMDDQSKISLWSGDDGRFRVERFMDHPHAKGFHGAPRVRVDVDRDQMNEALDELRKELKDLKKELKELKDKD